MAILRKLKNLMSCKTRRQVSEILALPKMDYADAIYRSLPLQLLKRLQKVQYVTASIVLRSYAKEKRLLKIGWLPTKERKDWHLLKLWKLILLLSFINIIFILEINYSWHLRVPDIGKTWVPVNLGNVVAENFHLWLNLHISAIIRSIIPSHKKLLAGF